MKQVCEPLGIKTVSLNCSIGREEYGQRLRLFAAELNKPHAATAVVLGDTYDLQTAVAPPFDVKLHLLAEYADYVAGIYEKESGGENPELDYLRRSTRKRPCTSSGLHRPHQ